MASKEELRPSSASVAAGRKHKNQVNDNFKKDLQSAQIVLWFTTI